MPRTDEDIRIEHMASRKMGAGRAWHVLVDGETLVSGVLSLGEFDTRDAAEACAARHASFRA